MGRSVVRIGMEALNFLLLAGGMCRVFFFTILIIYVYLLMPLHPIYIYILRPTSSGRQRCCQRTNPDCGTIIALIYNFIHNLQFH